jgi:EmrB/QacA subfamily drug resistance transporter
VASEEVALGGGGERAVRGVFADRVPQRVVAAIGYVAAMFMTAVDIQIVNVAIPTLSRDFNAGVSTVQWTVVGYTLSLAVLIPASGWLGDHFGTRRAFLFALGVFTLGSVLCGSAQTLGEVIAARVLQGAGGGMLTPVAATLLFRAYPPEDRARIARLLMVPILLGPASAPIIGGLFTQDVSWRWVFFINVPIGASVFFFCLLCLDDYRGAHRERFDVAGFVLGGGGLGLILYAISEGSTQGWDSAAVLVTGLLGIVALVIFTWWELREKYPVLNLRLLGERLFRATNVASCLIMGTFLGVLFLTPIFLQEVQHHSPISSGLTTFTEAFGVVLGSQTIARSYGRLGPRVLIAGGSVLICLVILTFQIEQTATSDWIVRAQMFALGVGVSVTGVAIQASMFTRISTEETGHASAIFNTGRWLSGAVFTAILSAILTGVAGSQLHAFHVAYLAAAVVAAVTAVTAVALIHTSDAAASMVKK